MSLINDALKRAKESHGTQTPPATPPPEKTGFRPVETAPSRGMPAWIWLVVIVILVGLGAFLIGQSTHKSGPLKSTTVAANENLSQPAPVAAPVPQRVEAAKTPVVEPVKAPIEKPVAALQTTATPVIAAPTLVAADTEAAALPVLKLQSIIYDPRRPSAMVNGKSLFVGDKISGLRVSEIHKNSVTLVGLGRTNVLELED